MRLDPFPSQYPSQLILSKILVHHSTHGITCLLPTLQLVRSTQKTTSPPILHQCSLPTNLAQARALLTTRCYYMVVQSLHQDQSSRRRTSTRPNSRVVEVGDQNLTLLTPNPLRGYLALLHPVQGNEKRGYMTDRGHGGPVFKCHDRAWAQLYKTFLARRTSLQVRRTIFFSLFLFCIKEILISAFLTVSGYDIADSGRTQTLLRPPGTTSPVGPAGGLFSGLVPRIEASSYEL